VAGVNIRKKYFVCSFSLSTK